MACGCSKGTLPTATAGQVYIFTHPATGKQTTYPTKYEAEFAKMRAGGSGNIRVAAKT